MEKQYNELSPKIADNNLDIDALNIFHWQGGYAKDLIIRLRG